MSAEPRILLPAGVQTEWPGKRGLETVGAPARSFAARVAPDIVGAVVTALLASAGAAFAMRLWEADLTVPFSYTDDGLLILGLVKTLLAEGWWLTSSSLGFPFGQELYDYPFAAGNTLHLLGIAGLGLLLGDPVLAINVFFLLGFPLIAVVAFLVFRRLGISIVVSVFAGSVFAILPYHFARNIDHLFLSSYYTIPIAGYLIVKVFSGRPLFDLSGSRRKQALQIAAVVAICVAIGSTATYYAVFTVLLLLVGGLISAVAHPRLGTLPGAAVASALILVTLLVAFTPVLVHRVQDGGNPAVAARGADETERLSLRISELVLPVGHHRLGPLADLRERYEEATPLPTESNQALGLVACVGLLTLLGVAVAAAVGRRWSAGPMRQLPPIAAATVAAILLATTGGFSTVVSYLGVTQLRGWNRMSILIAFFCVLAVALLLDAARARIARGLRGRVAFGALLAVLGVVALLDQTNDSFVPQYKAFKGEYVSDRWFVAAIERQLGPGSAVYQLPYVSFPEETNPPGGISAYAHLAPYAHSADLSWSFGSMRGRPEDWASALAPKPVATMALALAATGFEGLYVDRLGYDDAGSSLLGELAGLVGPIQYSANERRAFVDLRTYADRVDGELTRSQLAAVRELTLRPVRSTWDDAFWPLESAGGHDWRWSRLRRASLGLVNSGTTSRVIEVEFTLASGVTDAAQAVVTWPDGVKSLVDVTPEGARVSRRLSLEPGRSVIAFETNAGRAVTPPEDPRDALYLRVSDTEIRDVTFAGRFDAPTPVAALFVVTSMPSS